MFAQILNATIKGIMIATSGGALALGAGSLNLVDADFSTIVITAIFSSVFNFFYQVAKRYTQKLKRGY